MQMAHYEISKFSYYDKYHRHNSLHDLPEVNSLQEVISTQVRLCSNDAVPSSVKVIFFKFQF